MPLDIVIWNETCDEVPQLSDISTSLKWPGGEDPVVAGLLASLELISRPRSWCKFRQQTRRWYGPFRVIKWCSSGALSERIKNPLIRSMAEADLNHAVRRQNLHGISSIIEYNDRPATTHADLMAVWADGIAFARANASYRERFY